MTKILVTLNNTPMGQQEIDKKKNNNTDNNNEVAEEKASKDTNVEGIDTEHNAENEEEATGSDETDSSGNFKKSAEDLKNQEPEIETGEALDGALNNPAAPSGTGKQVSNSKGKGVADGDGGSIERRN